MTPGRCSRIVGLSLLVAASGIGMQAVTARAQDASAAAAAPAAQKIVKSITIRFQGARTMDDGRVRSQMSLREGEAYADERVEQDIRTLYGTGAIDDVAITSADVPGGVAVTVTLTGRGAIGDISFAGNTVFNDDRLRREIDDPDDSMDA